VLQNFIIAFEKRRINTELFDEAVTGFQLPPGKFADTVFLGSQARFNTELAIKRQ
jgi:hypothetical protein